MDELYKQLEKEREELFAVELDIRKAEHEYNMIAQRIKLIKREIKRKEQAEREMNKRRKTKDGL